MNLRLSYLASTLVLAAVAGCYTGSAVDTNRGPSVTNGTDSTDPASESPGTQVKTPTVAAPTGLPCNVAQVLNECSDCHGATPSGGATSTLLSFEDLTAKSTDDPTKTIAEIALGRMKSADRPMPPTGALSDASIATFEAWVTGGLQKGSCGETHATDAGTVTSVPPEPTPDPVTPPTLVCTSGKTASTRPGPLMAAGVACFQCHSEGGGAPAFAMAGTLYPSLHEPDKCVGVTGVNVLIIDANGDTHTMTTNQSGNFNRFTPVPLPYRAMVISGNKIREMKTPQMNGDCNSCHTGLGTGGAPGRVITP